MRDLRGQDRRVVVRQHVAERPELDVPRPGRARAPERERVGGDRELREEEVLDDAVRVVAEPVGVHDLLDHLVVRALLATYHPSTGSPSRSRTSSRLPSFRQPTLTGF